MTGTDDPEVTMVERCNLNNAQSLGNGYHRCV